MLSSKVAGQSTSQIFGFNKFAGLCITSWLDRSQDERFELLEVAVPDCQVDAEAIPDPFVSISQMMLQPITKVTCQSYVVKLVSPIERVDSRPTANVTTNDILIFL